MICKNCGREIEKNSVFCNWCGERQVKEKKKKDEIKVPSPQILPSGKWNIYLRAEQQSITEDTADKCIAKAKAVRAGFIEAQKKSARLTVSQAVEKFIAANDAVLSPSTVRGYQKTAHTHFCKYHDKLVTNVDWQKAINEEAKRYAPKSIHNAWGLMSKAMKYHGITPPEVKLPAKQPHELPWLNYQQIQIFLKEIHGEPCELAALLALHSLRKSELLDITPAKIDAQGIHVDGSRVVGPNGSIVQKQSNKTKAAKRVVPIMIPRLQELLLASKVAKDTPYVSQYHNTIFKQINRICVRAGLPEVGYHGLRRSFASLAYHLGWSERQTMAIGGWDDWQTMHKMYIKLDQTDLADAASKMQQFYGFTDEFTDGA